MNALKNRLGITLVLIMGTLACGVASAAPVVLDFDLSQGHGEYVDNYYNGGCSGAFNGGGVTCGGPNYGVIWNGAWSGWTYDAAGSDGYISLADEPSPPGVMTLLNSTHVSANVPGGFTTGFSFYYAGIIPGFEGTVRVFSGLDEGGALLATFQLNPTGWDCDPAWTYSCWDPLGVSFSGIARSVSFDVPIAATAGFDNMTFGSATPGIPGNGGGNGTNVPEPAALGMFGLGVFLIGGFVALRRRKKSCMGD